MGVKCEFCGAEYETPPGKFCDQCGRILARFSIEPEPDNSGESRKCHKCGHGNAMDATICVNCGEMIHEPRLA